MHCYNVCCYVCCWHPGQSVLTGVTESGCPGDVLVYTCERTGVDANAIIIWNLIVGAINKTDQLSSATPVRTLNESTSVPLAEGFTLMGNVSSSGTVIAVLQVNASSDYDGAIVTCNINGMSNTLTVSIRGESIY